ncbi:MAG: hypothetical protein Q9160_001314 [Pyrenula sp. 1 TL-2023]
MESRLPFHDLQVPKLNRELRSMIWHHLYQAQDNRLVEIRSLTSCDDHDGPCPRYSPSPPPAVANICHESRAEALRIARKANHLLFWDVQPHLPPIYFNPDIDTLYVRNEKVVWIRDFRPVGILTQLCRVEWPAEPRLSLAIELEPLKRATSSLMMKYDLYKLQKLKELLFVVRDVNDEVLEEFKSLRFSLESFDFVADYVWRRRGIRSPPPPLREQDLKLAVKSGCRLRLVEL